VDSVALQLKQAERVLRRQLEPALEAENLTFEHWQVLAALLAEPGQRMTELAHAACLPAPTLTRHVDRLVERALIIRRVDPNDRRSVLVALSDHGVALSRRLLDVETSASVVRGSR